MRKVIIDESKYSFNANDRQITFADLIDLKELLLITNITDNTIIYNFACSGFGGTLDRKVLTLEYNTRSMSDSDILQVVIANTDNEFATTNKLLDTLRKQTEVQDEMLEELKVCAKYLRKIYNPE